MSETHKIINVEDRKFRISKYDAFTAVKMAKLLVAKLLPAFNSVTDVIFQGSDGDTQFNPETMAEFLDFEQISRALDLVSDEDLDRIFNASLNVIEEELPAGFTKVRNNNGSYAVPGLEHDPVLMMRLIVEAVMWGVSGFFDANRLTSTLAPIWNSFQPKQST